MICALLLVGSLLALPIVLVCVPIAAALIWTIVTILWMSLTGRAKAETVRQ